MQKQITFTKSSLLKKTKVELVDLLFTQYESIKEQNNIIDEQFDTIKQMQEFKVNVENEIKEGIMIQNHFVKVNNAISISERRVKLCIDILEPIVKEGQLQPIKFIEDEDVIQTANNVLRNELEKIAKQQQVELKKQLEIK